MANWKGFIILIAIITIATSGQADGYSYYYNNTFNTTNTSDNISFSEPSSKIIYVTMPRRANITHASLNLTGYPYLYTMLHQNAYFDENKMYEALDQIFGHRINLTAGYMYNLTFWLRRFGHPQGNFSIRILNSSNKVVLKEVDMGLASDMSAAILPYTADINMYLQSHETDLEVYYNNTGSSSVNYIGIMYENHDYVDGHKYYWRKGSGYGSSQGYDMRFRYYYKFNETDYFPENVTIDSGNDGTVDYSNTTIFNTTETIDLNTTAINDYLRYTCTENFFEGYCDVPFNITTITNGTLEFSGLNISGEYLSGNFTINAYDELTEGGIPFNVTFTNGLTSYNSSGTNPFNVASELLPSGNNTVTISSDGYISRDYFVTINQDSNLNMTAFLIESGLGNYETIYVITYNSDPIENALITAQLDIMGYPHTVEQEYTDSLGSVTLYLNIYSQYYIIVEADGYVSETFTLNPDPINPVVYVRLQLTGEEGADYVNYTTMQDGISFQFLPEEANHNDSFNATYELSSSLSDLEYLGWNISYSNGTSFCGQVVTDQPSGTTLTCLIPNVSGRYTVEAYFKRTGYDEYSFNSFYNQVYHYSGITSFVTPTAISDIAYWIVAIVITLVATGFASRFVSGFASGWLAVGLFTLFVAINPTIMVANVSGWYIVGTMIISMISLTILRIYL